MEPARTEDGQKFLLRSHSIEQNSARQLVRKWCAVTGRKIAQMTDIWVRQNLPQAVGDAMTATILAQGWEFERIA